MSYKPVQFEPLEEVFHQGETGETMYLVQEGEVEVLQEMGGQKRSIAVLERGDFFGEMALLEREPRTMSVRAKTAAKLIQIDRRGLQQLLSRKPEIGVRMIKKLSRRVATREDVLYRALEAAAGSGPERPEKAAEASSPSLQAQLVHVQQKTRYPLPAQDAVLLGRLDPVNEIFPDVDLTVADPQSSVSRRHARILRQGNRFFVQELKATNGTSVNGQRVSADTPIELRHGDELMLGAVLTRFELV